jgi:hypothetical protein
MRLPWLVLVAACGGSPPAPAPSPAPHREQHAAPAPVDPHAKLAARARADEALHSDVPLDYERPFKSKPLDRTPTANLFGDACKDGDNHACIVEAQLRPLDDAGTGYKTVLAHCMAGDMMSCRALPPDDHAPRFPNAPGATSRTVECQHVTKACDVDALRRECTAGLAAACGELEGVSPPIPDYDRIQDRWVALLMQGCRHGIAAECGIVPATASRADQFDNAQRLCDLRPDSCTNLGDLYELRGDKAGERDNWERECEFGKDRWGVCIQLAERYVTGKLEEPVPGRGQALLDWACPKLAAYSPAARRRLAICDSAKHP